MDEIKIYGHSDHLIEVEGAIKKEFLCSKGKSNLAFSDGTVLNITYEKDGCWRISRAAIGTAKYEKTDTGDANEDYTDRVTLTGEIKWVVCGKGILKV